MKKIQNEKIAKHEDAFFVLPETEKLQWIYYDERRISFIIKEIPFWQVQRIAGFGWQAEDFFEEIDFVSKQIPVDKESFVEIKRRFDNPQFTDCTTETMDKLLTVIATEKKQNNTR